MHVIDTISFLIIFVRRLRIRYISFNGYRFKPKTELSKQVVAERHQI